MQLGVGFGVVVAEGRGAVAEGCGVVDGAVLGAGGAGWAGWAGWAGSGARVAVGAAGALLLAGAEADAVGLGPVRWAIGAAGALVTLGAAVGMAVAGAEALCDCAVSGPPAPGEGGAPSVPLAASAAAPRPATARPTTESTRTPGRLPDRRAPRREAAGPVARPLWGGDAPAGSGPGTEASGGVSRFSAGAPQPGQARAPFRWRRQGAQ